MPELPEVETVREGLDRLVVGAVVRDVEVFRDYSVRRHDGGPVAFRAELTGQRLAAAVRRGKFLWFPLTPAASATPAVGGVLAGSEPGEAAPTPPTTEVGEPAAALLAHLGMSGQLLVRAGTDADDFRHPHLRVRLHLEGAPSGARYVDFVDQRTFGHLSVHDLVPVPDGAPGGLGSDLAVVPGPVAHIARDLLDPYLKRASREGPGAAEGRDDLARRVRRRRTQIKRALLDQGVVSGVGNIYADEALWRARLHWARPTDRLRLADVHRVLDAAEEVMREALAHGGTSFDALYVNVNGQSGYFDRSLNVYGREGEPCRRCGTPIRRDPFMNRSAFTCPVCQPAPRAKQ